MFVICVWGNLARKVLQVDTRMSSSAGTGTPAYCGTYQRAKESRNRFLMAFNKWRGLSRGYTGALGGIRRRACSSRAKGSAGSDAARHRGWAACDPGLHPDPLAGTRYGTGSPKSDWQLSRFPSPVNQRGWQILGAANVELLVSTTECLR
jgi:hypothetical protein